MFKFYILVVAMGLIPPCNNSYLTPVQTEICSERRVRRPRVEFFWSEKEAALEFLRTESSYYPRLFAVERTWQRTVEISELKPKEVPSYQVEISSAVKEWKIP